MGVPHDQLRTPPWTPSPPQHEFSAYTNAKPLLLASAQLENRTQPAATAAAVLCKRNGCDRSCQPFRVRWCTAGCRRQAVCGHWGGFAGIAVAWHLLARSTVAQPVSVDLYDAAGEASPCLTLGRPVKQWKAPRPAGASQLSDSLTRRYTGLNPGTELVKSANPLGLPDGATVIRAYSLSLRVVATVGEAPLQQRGCCSPRVGGEAGSSHTPPKKWSTPIMLV